MTQRFTAVIQREDDGYVATVPSLPGCVTQADTYEELLHNIREAIEVYIEDCVEAGC